MSVGSLLLTFPVFQTNISKCHSFEIWSQYQMLNRTHFFSFKFDHWSRGCWLTMGVCGQGEGSGLLLLSSDILSYPTSQYPTPTYQPIYHPTLQANIYPTLPANSPPHPTSQFSTPPYQPIYHPTLTAKYLEVLLAGKVIFTNYISHSFILNIMGYKRERGSVMLIKN